VARTAQRLAPSPTRRSARATAIVHQPPRWIEPQLCKLVGKGPSGERWVHEIKFDG
jgi:ATP-dependent DNA ligase